jgi:hypothetical protein
VTVPRLIGSNRLILATLVIWALQPFAAGELIQTALDSANTGFRQTVSVAAWGLWALILLALVVARPVTLTISRVGIAGGLVGTVWAASDVIRRSGDTPAATVTVAVIAMVAAVVSVNLPGIADRFLDGVSYGTEQRFALRPPGPVLLLLVVPATLLVVVAVTIGPLLLADQRWVAGGIATAVGFPIAAVPLNALHRLGNRFLVFVPNGLVVHDLTTLREPVLFVHREIVGIAPARVGSDATDITNAALGMALELRLHEPLQLPFVTGRTATESRTVNALLVAPTRPAAVLTAAVQRGIPVG